MTKFRSMLRNQAGAAAIEFALAVPVLVVMIYGIFQVGIAFQASAGMQHALGEGARLATICKNPTADGICSVATTEEIKAKISAKVFGTGVGTFSEPSVTTPPTADCTKCRLLSVTFSMPTNFLLFQGPTINLTRTKRVYVAG
jgi:Flp pilus assembly protein TadG